LRKMSPTEASSLYLMTTRQRTSDTGWPTDPDPIARRSKRFWVGFVLKCEKSKRD